MQLQETVQQQLNLLVENGTVENIIKTQLESTIKSVFSDTLREYSDFGKQLKETISKAINVDLSKLSLLDYNHIVTTIVKEELDKTIFASVKEPITKAIQGYTGELEKKEWKLSEIVEKFIDGIEKNSSYGEITVEVERTKYGSVHIGIDEESNTERYKCEYQFSLNIKEGIIYHFECGSYKKFSGDLRETNVAGGFDKLLFKLYAMQCKIDVDENNCETCWDLD